MDPVYAIIGVFFLAVLMAKMNPASASAASAGVATGSKLTPQQVYNYARGAGFPSELARRMVAIAIRESGLDPTAVCESCLGVPESSWGLWQINMMGALGESRKRQFGIREAKELLNPSVSAAAAYQIWGGSENNLNIAWSLNRNEPYPYRDKYIEALNKLPAASEMEAKRNGFV